MARETLDAEVLKLQEQTLGLLRTDLDLCHTLAAVAESKICDGNHQHAAPTLARAVKGYAEINRILRKRQGEGEEIPADISEKLAVLRGDLNRLQQLVQAAGT